MIRLILLLGSVWVLLVGANDCDVTIGNGRVIGNISETLNPEKKVCSYLGIPFAAPPVGELRFKPPTAPEPWDSLDATKLPNWCPQAGNAPPGRNMSEDCLYLNVYVPQTETGELPVMIWIYGGSMTSGSADPYTPTRLLARGDVILVVPHYRVGILGFYSTGDLSSPGNWGMKDQAFAIKWVHQNIAKFGGNPNQVTLFGESAGATSVLLQLLHPPNLGLIQGVIAQSGTAITSAALDKNPVESGKLIAQNLSCPITSSEEMISCMRSIPWSEFISLQQTLNYEGFKNFRYPVAGVKPVVEPVHTSTFISEAPLEIMKKGNVPRIPVMLGANKHDGSLLLGNQYLLKWGPEGLDRDQDYMRNQIVPDLLKFFKNEEDGANRAVSSSVELAYLSGVNRSSWNESMPGLVDIMTVFTFKSSVLHTADLLSSYLPVYLYSYEHHSNNSFVWDSMPVKPPIQPGVAHADELLFLFEFPSTFTPQDQEFSNLFTDMWLNFGRFGNPTPDDNHWPNYDMNNQFYMKLNITPTVLQDYYSSWRPNGFEWS